MNQHGQEYRIERTAFAIMRTDICPECDHEIILVAGDPKLGAYQHATMCVLIKVAQGSENATSATGEKR